MTEQNDVSEIERLESVRYAAMLSQDVEALDVLLHDRLLHVHPRAISTRRWHISAD